MSFVGECQVFDFPRICRGADTDELAGEKDSTECEDVDTGVCDDSICLNDKATRLTAEARDLILSGLLLFFWSWSKDRIVFHFTLPDRYLDYRDKRERHLAHVKAVFGRIRAITTPAIFQKMADHMGIDAYDPRCDMFKPLRLKKVTRVKVLEQAGRIEIEFMTELDLRDIDRAGPDRISCIRQSRVNAIAFTDCQYTFACD